MSVRFISDLHKGHYNLATKLRGFGDTRNHDENLIAQWNSVCHKKDVIYILGDLTMEKNDYSFLDSLNGTKHVILGNHEKLNAYKELSKYVSGIGGMINYKTKQFPRHRFILTHSPVHPFDLDLYETKGYKVYNIHGHLHSNKINDPRYINVSAEVIDYKPKTLEELIK